ncbi:LOW QUALITY PROTEIN: helicase with zinc finger domain 2-like [Haliotis rubra]|uniref:LOW QUALITY PROTEIN: helicase with zinc finger domain 2-like n=1 Tax=Haliotis rubra TaxID=36100 RepID=UPI001EE5661A|nr:LOW QUALITY PROTEIN: helicase with zinc finger domain 2-like [Haliotis rubra]
MRRNTVYYGIDDQGREHSDDSENSQESESEADISSGIGNTSSTSEDSGASEPEVDTSTTSDLSPRTWFEKSQGRFDGQDTDDIVVGESLDIVYYPKEPHQDILQLRVNEELHTKLQQEPQTYKRCIINLKGPHFAVCKIQDDGNNFQEIEIHGRGKIGNTFNNDEVAVEILNNNVDEDTENASVDDKLYGKVVGVLRSKFRETRFPVLACTVNSKEKSIVIPMCNSIPRIRIWSHFSTQRIQDFNNSNSNSGITQNNKHFIDVHTYEKGKQLKFQSCREIIDSKKGQYVLLVVLLSWSKQFPYPVGAVVKVLECGTTFESGLNALIPQFKVPRYYPRNTVQATVSLAGKIESGILQAEDTKREKYQHLSVFTVDNSNSKDLDDALSVWKVKQEDVLLVGVHITDVTTFVKKGDDIDKTAEQRATTFFPTDDRGHHMIPENLSQDLLSLLPNCDRFAISVLFKIDKRGNIIGKPSVARSIIRSDRKFSYKEVQNIIDGQAVSFKCKQSLKSSIRVLHVLAKKFRKERLGNSRFEVRFEDPRFVIENKQGAIDAHNLIEEFMIRTNGFIGEWLMESWQHCVPLRCQSAPPVDTRVHWVNREGNIIDLLVKLQSFHVLDDRECCVAKHCFQNREETHEHISVQKGVWEELKEAGEVNDFAKARDLLCCDALHPLQCLANHRWVHMLESATYKCSSKGKKYTGHFSLNMFPYTHFTSPMRRYVDLIVHRLVHAVLDGQEAPYTQAEMEKACEQMTEACQREIKLKNTCRTIRKSEMLSKKPLTFNAVVERVSDSSVALFIPSLRGTSYRRLELPLNLLDCCRKPVVEISPSGREQVLCFWRKRLYRYEERPERDRRDQTNLNQIKKPEQFNILLDENMHTEEMPLPDFAKALKEIFNASGTKEVVPNIKDTSVSHRRGVKMLADEKYGDMSVCHFYGFRLIFYSGQVLKVQVHAEPEMGMLTPYVQLFHVCANYDLCLTHLEDPVHTFAEYVMQPFRNRHFRIIEEYQETWLPVVRMESALNSVGSKYTIVIDNVNTLIRNCNQRLIGRLILDAKFCDFRQIEIGGKGVDRMAKMKAGESPFKMPCNDASLDYLCLRHTPRDYDPSSMFSSASVWVGHALIKKVKLRKPKGSIAGSDPHAGTVVIAFEMRPNTIPPPPNLIDQEFQAAAEIILKSQIDRRTEQMLEILDTEGSELARNIALKGGSLLTTRLRSAQLSSTDLTDEERKLCSTMIINNFNQGIAIQRALDQPFSLIQGPPGTGKTTIGVKLVYLFNKINRTNSDEGKRQVLYCGPSNKSVDLVAGYMIKKLGKMCPRIIRLYGKTIEENDKPVPKKIVIADRNNKYLKSDPEIRKVTLHFVIRQDGRPHAEEIRTYDERFQTYFDDPQKENITLEDLKAYDKLIARAEKHELAHCDVILCTCVVAGGKKLTEVANINQCIIDESGMCTEPQSMIPIIATKAQQVVLIGDHRQLRPIVKCSHAASLGLDQSLFERYKKDAAFLNIQYRMHPEICQFPSSQFYKGALKTEDCHPERAAWYIAPGKELSIWPVSTNPKVFCHVAGKEETLTVTTQDGNEQSKSNRKEAEKVCEVVRYLVNRDEIPVENINVMSQYSAQRSLIKEMLEKKSDANKNLNDLRVQTVVASQGGEWDYVIFSTVRSLPRYKIEDKPTLGWRRHNLGFITDENQINVALTRARKGLIIVGNSHLLKCDPIWKQLLGAYRTEMCFVMDADFFPPT